MPSSVPVLAQALHAADKARADKSVAEFISEFLREDKVKFEEDNRRLKKEIKEICETHRTEMEKLMDEMKRMNAENTQRFKVQLDEQRKDLEDQMEKKVSGLRQEHKVQLDEQRKDLEDQMEKKVSGLHQEHKVQLDEQRKDLEDQMEKKFSGLRQEHKVDTARFREEIEEGRRELRSRIEALERSVEDWKALTMLANPLLLRILMDDVKEPLIQGAIDSLPFGITRDAFNEMFRFTYDRPSVLKPQ